MKIFAFPCVVIDELMKEFDPVDLIKLSFCSKIAHSFIKTYAKIKDDLEVETSGSYGYSVQFPEKNLIGVVSEKNMNLVRKDPENHFFLKRWTKKHGRLCVSQDVVQACRAATNYICDLFNIPVSTVTVAGEEDFWLLDFAEQRQVQTLKKVFAHTDDVVVSAEHYSRVLNCNATESLICELRPPEGYRFDGKLPAVSKMFTYYGFWITREHLLGLDVSYADFERTELTSADMNAVLRCWLNGGLPNLKCLKMSVRTSVSVSVEGIDKSVRDRLERVQGEIRYKRNHIESGVKFHSNAYHLRREDNVVATVEMAYNQFAMAVWPDAKGNRV